MTDHDPLDSLSEFLDGDSPDTVDLGGIPKDELARHLLVAGVTRHLLREAAGGTEDSVRIGMAAVFADGRVVHRRRNRILGSLAAAAAVTKTLAATRYGKDVTTQQVRAALAEEIATILEPVAHPLVLDPAHKPFVILVTGVNGTGKTTTVGKLASHFREDGKTVFLAAGDTFRAAAIDQLQIWGDRAGARVIAGTVGADAAGLAFHAYS